MNTKGLKILVLLSTLILCGCSKPNDNPPEDSFQIHYKRTDKKYDDWALWLWEYPNGGGEQYTFNGTDDFGAVASYPLSKWPTLHISKTLGFIIKKKDSWDKDVDMDRFAYFSQLEKDNKNVYHIYLLTGDPNIYINKNLDIMDGIKSVRFTDTTHIAIKTTTNFNKVRFYKNNQLFGEEKLKNPKNEFTYTFKSGTQAAYDANYRVEIVFESGKTFDQVVDMSTLFASDDFSNKFNYPGELGAIYTSNKTTFKVWSPLSSNVVLKIYNNGTPKSIDAKKGSDEVYKEVKMIKGEKGVFSTTVNGDLAGKYYTYTVTNSTYANQEIVDPYAKGCGVNGLRGMIVDFSKTNPDGWDAVEPLNIDRKAMTVYETHIADLTSSETWASNSKLASKAKKYEGFMTSGTTYTNGNTTVKTGFDHIKELGVNAVQILPIFDQDNDEVNPSFNWGYNPLNYNCVEGVYSMNPYDGYTRIKEFKSLVKAYNDEGISIIMDVVYNHVSSALASNLNVLLPGYFFRHNEDGSFSNGSGCGNETSSELYMTRKFMIDSIKFWTKEYKLGGFRFDLMGLHDLDTMEAIVNAAKAINPNIVIYGEPWAGGTSPLPEGQSAKQVNINEYNGYGAFNDRMRDALIKGGLSQDTDTGWVTNATSGVDQDDKNRINAGINGYTKVDNTLECKDPNKTLNYVTCHDNYTLYDRIKAINSKNPIDDTTAKKMAMLANSVVFTSNGTTFMLAGEEFLRTKGGDKNSYNSGYKVNELDYSLKVKNLDMFENYKKLIQLKQEQDFLHHDKDSSPLSITVDNNMIKYTATNTNSKEYVIIHANGLGGVSSQDLSGYILYLDTLYSEKSLSTSTPISPYETLIAYKSA